MSLHKMIESIHKDIAFLKKRATPVVWVTAATAFNNLLAFVVNVVAARTLGAEGYGVFALAFAVATLVGLLGDLGFNLSMIRLFNKYQADPERQSVLLGVALGVKGMLFFLLAVVFWPLSKLLALRLGADYTSNGLMAVALLTGGLLFFWTYLQSYLQAYRAFKWLTTYIIVYSWLRLAGLPIAYIFFPQNPMAWLVATYTAPLLALALIAVPSRGYKVIASLFARSNIILSIIKELLDYSKWVGLSAITYAAMPYVVRLILATRASVEEVGVFSAGMTFTVAFSTLNTAIRAVLFPQVTALEGREAIGRYLGRLARVAPYYAAFATLGIASLGFLQWYLLGVEYRTALPVFFATATALAISVFVSTQTMLLHTMMRPDIDAKIDSVRIVLLVAFTLLAAPRYGALGSALLYSGVIVAGALSKVLLMNKLLKQEDVGHE